MARIRAAGGWLPGHRGGELEVGLLLDDDDECVREERGEKFEGEERNLRLNFLGFLYKRGMNAIRNSLS